MLPLLERDAFRTHEDGSLLTPSLAPFADAMHPFAGRQEIINRLLADPQRRLAGLMAQQQFASWASRPRGSHGIRAEFEWRDLARLANAATAHEACRPQGHQLRAGPDDPRRDAPSLLLTKSAMRSPLLDGAGRALGDARPFQVLAVAPGSHHT
jgi:hypothetical protein